MASFRAVRNTYLGGQALNHTIVLTFHLLSYWLCLLLHLMANISTSFSQFLCIPLRIIACRQSHTNKTSIKFFFFFTVFHRYLSFLLTIVYELDVCKVTPVASTMQHRCIITHGNGANLIICFNFAT